METHKKQSNERLTWVTSLSVTLFVEIGEVSVARPDFFPRLLDDCWGIAKPASPYLAPAAAFFFPWI